MTRSSDGKCSTAPCAPTADRQGTISTTYRGLRILGFDEREAGNLTAYHSGVAIGPQPWTVWELTHLLFLREMNRRGRRWSDADDRATDVGGARPSIGEWRAGDDGRVNLQPLFSTPDLVGKRDREGGAI